MDSKKKKKKYNNKPARRSCFLLTFLLAKVAGNFLNQVSVDLSEGKPTHISLDACVCTFLFFSCISRLLFHHPSILFTIKLQLGKMTVKKKKEYSFVIFLNSSFWVYLGILAHLQYKNKKELQYLMFYPVSAKKILIINQYNYQGMLSNVPFQYNLLCFAIQQQRKCQIRKVG